MKKYLFLFLLIFLVACTVVIEEETEEIKEITNEDIIKAVELTPQFRDLNDLVKTKQRISACIEEINKARIEKGKDPMDQAKLELTRKCSPQLESHITKEDELYLVLYTETYPDGCGQPKTPVLTAQAFSLEGERSLRVAVSWPGVPPLTTSLKTMREGLSTPNCEAFAQFVIEKGTII